MTHLTSSAVLQAPMPAGGDPEWPGAVWIGSVVDQPTWSGIRLEGGDRYNSCRLLVRTVRGNARGFVNLPVEGGAIDPVALRAAIDTLPTRERDAAVHDRGQAITVAISTRNRADHLQVVLESLLRLQYDELNFLIVDNASSDTKTERIVAAVGDSRFGYLREDRVGLSYGRNLALLKAKTPIVAFTDDDVVVDAQWVSRLAAEFRDDVGLVGGMVPTGEMRTPAQRYFEQQAAWETSCAPRMFRLNDPPGDIRAFPLDAGRYGAGANFAVRRDLAIRLGGFNEALGIGSPTHGGEDLDMFVRVIYSGWAIAYTPDALVWHRHRSDAAALEKAVVGYSTGFSAWMLSLLENPATRSDAVRIGARHVFRRIAQLAQRVDDSSAEARSTDFDLQDFGFEHLPRSGLRALASGPRAYVTSRRAGRRTRPLLGAR